MNNAPALSQSSQYPPGVMKPLYQPVISSQKAPFLPPQPMPMVSPMIFGAHSVAYPQPTVAPYPPSSMIAAPIAALTPEDEEEEVDVDELMALCVL